MSDVKKALETVEVFVDIDVKKAIHVAMVIYAARNPGCDTVFDEVTGERKMSMNLLARLTGRRRPWVQKALNEGVQNLGLMCLLATVFQMPTIDFLKLGEIE